MCCTGLRSFYNRSVSKILNPLIPPCFPSLGSPSPPPGGIIQGPAKVIIVLHQGIVRKQLQPYIRAETSAQINNNNRNNNIQNTTKI